MKNNEDSKMLWHLDEKPAFFLSLGRPALMRTSRSTWLNDSSPRARPDVIPASSTSTTHEIMNIQNLRSLHGA